jgi:hypothetical protein
VDVGTMSIAPTCASTISTACLRSEEHAAAVIAQHHLDEHRSCCRLRRRIVVRSWPAPAVVYTPLEEES